MAGRIGRHVPPRDQQPVHRARHQATIRHRHRRQFRRQRGRHADLVAPRGRFAPALARHPGHARQAPRMAHAKLWRRQHQERGLEARRVRAVCVEVLRHQPVRADLHLGQVLDVDRRVARQPRPHEQRHIVAPGRERPFEQPAAQRAAELHEGGEAGGVAGLERDPAGKVAAAPDPRRVHAVVDVALLDVGIGARAGTGENVAIAGAVHRDTGADR